MDELSPEMLCLIDATRHAYDPDPGDRERLHTRLAPMLAAGAGMASAAGAAATSAPATTAWAAAGTRGTVAPPPIATTLETATAAATKAGSSARAAATGLPGSTAAGSAAVAAKLPLGQVLLWVALGTGIGAAGTATTVALAPAALLGGRAPLVENTGPALARNATRHARAPLKPAPGTPTPTGNPETALAAPARGATLGSPEAAPTTPALAATLGGDEELAPASRPSKGGAHTLQANDAAARRTDSMRSERARASGRGAPNEADRAKEVDSLTVTPRVLVTTLAAETRLVGAAQDALRRGDGARASELLHEHAQRFPNGLLQVERRVSQVLSLCAQGRAEESNRQRRRILRESPNHPAVAGLDEPCSSPSR